MNTLENIREQTILWITRSTSDRWGIKMWKRLELCYKTISASEKFWRSTAYIGQFFARQPLIVKSINVAFTQECQKESLCLKLYGICSQFVKGDGRDKSKHVNKMLWSYESNICCYFLADMKWFMLYVRQKINLPQHGEMDVVKHGAKLQSNLIEAWDGAAWGDSHFKQGNNPKYTTRGEIIRSNYILV